MSYTALWQAILSLRDAKECAAFFADLCTAKELSELSSRLEVAALLGRGENYNEIARRTGASTATISRVSKALSGKEGGYRTVLSRAERPCADAREREEPLPLLPIERLAFLLLARFEKRGYARYAPSVFAEETLAQTLGDLTLSPPEGISRKGGTCKYCYYQSILRREEDKRVLRRLSQVGAECIGRGRAEETREILLMAEEALSLLHTRYLLCVTPIAFSDALLTRCGIFGAYRRALYELLRGEPRELSAFLLSHGEAPETSEMLASLLACPRPLADALTHLQKAARSEEEIAALSALKTATAGLDGAHVRVDLTCRPARDYYEGLFFTGRVGERESEVLYGGRYDTLARRNAASDGAVGFAVYLDRVAEDPLPV